LLFVPPLLLSLPPVPVAVCVQLSNIDDLEKLKNPTNLVKQARDHGFVTLSYTTAHIHHVDIEWVDHDHKARIQKLWELLDKYIKYTAAGKGEPTIITPLLLIGQTLCVRCVDCSRGGYCCVFVLCMAECNRLEGVPTQDQVKAQLQAMSQVDEAKASKSKKGGKKSKEAAKENDDGGDDGSYQPTMARPNTGRGSVQQQLQSCTVCHAAAPL